MKKLYISVAIVIILIIGALVINQWFTLRKAHSTFENYYAFRGCVKLLEKKDSYGTCKTENGQTIKIVKYQNKWYLNGDLPWACIGKLCFGL